MEFTWTGNAAEFEFTCIMPDGSMETLNLQGNSFIVNGLNPGDAVSATVVAIGTAPCGNSPTSNSVTCVAEDCPTIAPTIDNLPSEICTDASAITLEATPAGGIFSGQGVTGNTLDLTGLPASNTTITYDYTDPATGCSYTTSQAVSLSNPFAQPVILCGATTTSSVEFTWSDVGAASYEITWSGATSGTQIVNGTSFVVNGLATNDMVTATIVAIGGAPCFNSATSEPATCTAEDCPTITPTIDGLASEYCENETMIALSGMPTGGTFSGDGVMGTNFDPSTVMGNTATIIYMYTDPASGCDYSTQQVVNIIPELAVPVISCGMTTPTSIEFTWSDVGATSYEITYTLVAGGTDTQTTNGTSFTVTGLMPGDMITATVVAIGTNICGNSAISNSVTCTADACPTIVPSIDNVNAEYCQNEAAFALIATPAGGTFSGNGVTNGMFNPMNAGLGDVTITYTYIDPATNCDYTTTINTFIAEQIEEPVVFCAEVGLDFVTFEWNDVGAAQYEITVSSTSNGTNTSVITSTTHTESGLMVNENVSIFVIALSDNACGNSTAGTADCTAQDCPTIVATIDNLNAEYCGNDAAFTLMGTPSGGTFSGAGVSGNQFDPANAGATSTTITYTYIDPTTNCEYNTQETVTILPPFGTPTVSCGDATMNSVTFNWTDVGTMEYQVTVTIAGQAPTTNTTSDLFLVVNGLNPSDMVTIEVVAIGIAPCSDSPAGTATCETDPCVPSNATISGIETVCGGQSATITFNFEGTGPYNVTYLENGGNPVTLMNIADGHVETVSPFATTNYTIDAAEDLGNANCAVNTSGTATITVSTNITFDLAVISDFNGNAISCNGETDGEAQASNPMGGTAPYNYVWSDGQTGETATNLAAGIYEVTATDANGCSGTADITLTEPIPINAVFTAQNPLCFGDPNGWIQIENPSGGAEPYLYAINNGALSKPR